MSTTDYQTLLQRAFEGDSRSLHTLIWNRVCPHCGNSPMNVSWPAAGIPREMMAACLICGWTSSPRVRLRQVPQFLLSQRFSLVKQAAAIRKLVRDAMIDNAEVESGPYRAAAHTSSAIVCTQTSLKSVLSTDEFERIKRMLPRQNRKSVTVKLTGSLSASSYLPRQPFAPFCEMTLADDSAPVKSGVDRQEWDESHDRSF